MTADGVFVYDVQSASSQQGSSQPVAPVIDEPIGVSADESVGPVAFSGPIPPLTKPTDEQPLQA